MPGLEVLHVFVDLGYAGLKWGASLLAGLGASTTRHSLQELRMAHCQVWEDVQDAVVVAAASRLRELRRLKIDGKEWTFVRGTVVGRSAACEEG